MIRNPEFADHVRKIFAQTPFVNHLGVTVDSVTEGACESSLAVEPRHLQQDGFVHAGVLATIADHTAGGAAATLLAADQGILSIEFKVNLLRPARGARLHCKATVLKAGKTLSVVEAEVFSIESGGPILAVKATVTLAVVPWQAK